MDKDLGGRRVMVRWSLRHCNGAPAAARAPLPRAPGRRAALL
ncbi:hypothetical protein [Burkholderia pseudomallei]|nr:hypothetical protein [Burkholderia pseudomallei]ABN82960.1 hypothetical protein BURPS668_0823 [Burkholderia pseudomallei 668]